MEEYQKIFEDFVESFKGGPKQGSLEWVSGRSCSVGGSEIAVLFGMNPYQKPIDLLARKLGLDKFNGNEACWWGTFFESCTERFVELDLDTKIVGTDIHVNHRQSGLKHHSNSPDGYCIVKIDGKPFPVVLELKAPHGRIPDGKVPRHYLPQVWSGIWTSPAWCGLFVDASIRLCTLDDLDGTGKYREDYHISSHKKKPQWDSIRAWGMTAIYRGAHVNDMELTALLEYIAIKGCNEWADLGMLPKQLVGWLLKHCTNHNLEYQHSDPQFGDSTDTINDLVEKYNRDDLLGFLPWKVMQVEYVVVPPNPDFGERAAPLLEEFFEEVNKIRASGDICEGYANLRNTATGLFQPAKSKGCKLLELIQHTNTRAL
jgi:hypothetical protein